MGLYFQLKEKILQVSNNKRTRMIHGGHICSLDKLKWEFEEFRKIMSHSLFAGFFFIIIIWLSNFLALSVPDKGYSRNASCALNLIFTFLMYKPTNHLNRYSFKWEDFFLRIQTIWNKNCPWRPCFFPNQTKCSYL